MFHKFLQFFTKQILYFFCNAIYINNKQLLTTKGPLLLVANHPNSFFDAIIIASFFKRKVFCLARGDAFTKPWHRLLLSPFSMIPIYRLSEGKENLTQNYNSFEACNQVLANNGILLIFIEGICKNTHHLMPFKKGAARIVQDCIHKNIPLQIMPIALGYSNFFENLVTVNMSLNPVFSACSILNNKEPLYKKLNNMVHLSITSSINIPTQKNTSILKKILHFIFKPLSYILQFVVKKATKNTVFFHSILFASYFLCAILLIFICIIILFFIS